MAYFAFSSRRAEIFEEQFCGGPPELVVLAVNGRERRADAVDERYVVEAGDRDVRGASEAPLPQRFDGADREDVAGAYERGKADTGCEEIVRAPAAFFFHERLGFRHRCFRRLYSPPWSPLQVCGET